MNKVEALKNADNDRYFDRIMADRKYDRFICQRPVPWRRQHLSNV